MASITGYGSKHSHEFVLTVTETGTSQSGNYSTVDFTFTIYKASYSWSGWNSISYIVTINGQQYTGTIPSYSAGSTKTITSGSLTVPHDANGSKVLYFSFSVTDNSGQSYTCGNASASGSMYLTNIARNPSILLSEYDTKDTYYKIYWSSDMVIDALWISYNNGTTWNYVYNPNATSGVFNCTPAIPNTTYSNKVRVRGKDSQLTSDSGVLTITTKDISRIASMEAVVHGEPIKFVVTSPADNNPITLEMIVDNTEIFTRTVSKGNNSITLTDNELDLLYSLYGNSSTLTATFNLTSNDYVDTRSETVTFKGNQKTMKIKKGSWKRGKANIKVSGYWKKAVIWERVSGTWKRGV